MTLPLEFVVKGTARSQRSSRSGDRWQRQLNQVVQENWQGQTITSGPFKVTITCFHYPGKAAPDVDNIPKPILDTLSGLVYGDDQHVTDLVCRKRDLSINFAVLNPSALLIAALGESESFVHVIVEFNQHLEVEF